MRNLITSVVSYSPLPLGGTMGHVSVVRAILDLSVENMHAYQACAATREEEEEIRADWEEAVDPDAL